MKVVSGQTSGLSTLPDRRSAVNAANKPKAPSYQGASVNGPRVLTSDQVLRDAVALAVRAPSIHNTQPWKFRLGQGRIELYADRSRQLPVADDSGRAMFVSCGAALVFARLALQNAGF